METTALARWTRGDDRDELTTEDLAPEGFGPHADTLGLVGRSPALLALGERLRLLGKSHATVLVRGETGTGKELIARALHRLSPRADRPFLPHNFASIPDTLVESELFGHARGSFTGAHADRAGLFEQASGGTLFLDEIGDASPGVQSRLLRVLQEGEIRRVGDHRARRVDVRIVAATHRDLVATVRAGRFREDLYYRLHVLEVSAPALRDRRDDVPLLAAHVLKRLRDREALDVAGISRGAVRRLVAHDWPGNVRELEAVLTRAAHVVAPGESIREASLGDVVAKGTGWVRDRPEALREKTRAFEAGVIEHALKRHGGNRTRAARELGMTRQGLWKKIRRLRPGASAEETPAEPAEADASAASMAPASSATPATGDWP
ncbi:MAG TPA: sigma-54 dependent transcriptional regulator [Candidatus Eisenbacteria bacterium]|nr:sigma-54 dependent transcriptional regulator [Candidatus Eisenbacteria bacterium]